MSRFGLQKLYIHGAYVDSTAGKTFNAINPANGEVLAEVQAAGAEDVDRAVASAASGQKVWAAMTAMARSRILRRAVDILRERNDELAALETLDTGKAMSETTAVDIVTGADVLEYYAGLIPAIEGEQIPLRETSFVYTRREPLGVVAGIGAWNYPIQIALWKSAPALAAGNAMIFKPSEVTSLTALKLAEIYTEAGLPDGVFNVVTGSGAEVGQYLTDHPGIAKVSFTGGVKTGKKVMANASGSTLKEVTMELGGKSPLIIFDDADLDAAVAGAVASKYRNAGQTCVCTNRFLVQDGVYDAFAAKLKAAVAKLKVGNGLDDGVTIGPLINPDAVEKVREHIADAVEHGASVLLGGKPDALGGNFFTPTVLGDVQPGSLLLEEEIFGPVAPLIRFNQEAEAIELANDTPFGLAAYFYSRDIGQVMRVAEALEYGIVGINEGLISTEVAPFGGMKHSGLGREGSKYGIEDYLEIKYLCLGGLGA